VAVWAKRALRELTPVWRMKNGDFARSSSSPPSCRLCLKRTGAQVLGRSRGGLTTRIHVVVDAIGRLIQGCVSAGQVPDITQAWALLDGVPA
jgi:hypothetical protein